MPSIFTDYRRSFATQSKLRPHSYASVAALLFFCSLTFGQNIDSPSPRAPTGTATPAPVRQTPTPQTTEQPRRTGGGSFGINIDIGSVINLLREVTKKDEPNEEELEKKVKEQLDKERPRMTMEQLSQQFKTVAANKERRTSLINGTAARQGTTERDLQPQTQSCKTNGNFETASLANWSGADNGAPSGRSDASRSNITTVGINSGVIGLDTSHQTIVGVGNDPTVGALLQQVRPGGGSSSVRIGNTAKYFGAELLSKSFKVSAADAIVGFSYALVMQNPQPPTQTLHTPADQPAFIVRVLNSSGTDITNSGIPGGRVRLTNSGPPNVIGADINNPIFQTYISKESTTPIAYKDWACSEINLSDLIGQDVTIEFITIDCGLSAHFAYAYIDDFCTTCGPGPEGSIKLAESDKCGVGKVCVDVTVPKTDKITGQATASLDIWQNGTKLTTYTSPAISADGKVCFPLNPSTIPGLDKTKGFDYSAQASMTINGASGPYSLPSKLLGAGPDGLQPGSNNDYTPTCSVSSPLCITCLCGHPGQPVCPACGQAGQPLCAQSCLAADYAQPIKPPKPDVSPKTRNAVGNATTKVKK
jgi:hypothetical protein